MLHHLADLAPEYGSWLNIFKYLTFRASLAFFLSFGLVMLFGTRFIAMLKRYQQFGQPIRSDGPKSHLKTKQGTPTMGGIMILFSCLMSTIMFADITNPYIQVVIFVLLSFGILGFLDDYNKIRKQNSHGLPGKIKMLWQIITSVIALYIIFRTQGEGLAMNLQLPILKNISINLGLGYYIFGILVVSGASNAVNLTDGLDGLVSVPVILVSACFAVFAYVAGNKMIAQYLRLDYIAGTGELIILCAAIIGAVMGFLWYNIKPAQVFMGDVGSLSLGGVLGIISIMVKQEILLAVAGGLFVIEALSVMIQVFYFKLYGKRVFLMAPIHHHFEKKGWSEVKVVQRFWLLSVLFAILSLSTLKIR